MKFRKEFVLSLVVFVLFLSCEEKELTPEEKRAAVKKEILSEAPVKFDYDIETPNKNLPKILRSFSGHWIGKWDEKFSSQLIVTNIDREKAKFIYSWEADSNDNIPAGVISETAEVQPNGRLIYSNKDERLTFAIDTLLNKIIGVYLRDDIISNIIMEKIN